MSYTYAIGDIQGCYEPLRQLIAGLPFDESHDRLWFVGDLINRGPENLATLEYVKELGNRATTVLGNHDLHLLAIVFGGKNPQSSDTFQDVLDSPRCEELSHWLRKLPLMHGYKHWVMVHAGLPHIWSAEKAANLAREVEDVIGSDDYTHYFENMYGNSPDTWDEALAGMDRLRLITNYFTRMRFISDSGKLEFAHKTTLDDQPEGYQPWFKFPHNRTETVVFGHWAALDGQVDAEQVIATDTGCVWGRGLTAVRLEDNKRFQWLDGAVICQN